MDAMRNTVSGVTGAPVVEVSLHAERAHTRELAVGHHAEHQPRHVLLAHEFLEDGIEAGEHLGRVAAGLRGHGG